MRRGSELTPVAIKMIKNTNSDNLQDSFLKEMRIMSQMMHPNIVRLYGLVTEGTYSVSGSCDLVGVLCNSHVTGFSCIVFRRGVAMDCTGVHGEWGSEDFPHCE